jgi:hypothetical protein
VAVSLHAVAGQSSAFARICHNRPELCHGVQLLSRWIAAQTDPVTVYVGLDEVKLLSERRVLLQTDLTLVRSHAWDATIQVTLGLDLEGRQGGWDWLPQRLTSLAHHLALGDLLSAPMTLPPSRLVDLHDRFEQRRAALNRLPAAFEPPTDAEILGAWQTGDRAIGGLGLLRHRQLIPEAVSVMCGPARLLDGLETAALKVPCAGLIEVLSFMRQARAHQLRYPDLHVCPPAPNALPLRRRRPCVLFTIGFSGTQDADYFQAAAELVETAHRALNNRGVIEVLHLPRIAQLADHADALGRADMWVHLSHGIADGLCVTGQSPAPAAHWLDAFAHRDTSVRIAFLGACHSASIARQLVAQIAEFAVGFEREVTPGMCDPLIEALVHLATQTVGRRAFGRAFDSVRPKLTSAGPKAWFRQGVRA